MVYQCKIRSGLMWRIRLFSFMGKYSVPRSLASLRICRVVIPGLIGYPEKKSDGPGFPIKQGKTDKVPRSSESRKLPYLLRGSSLFISIFILLVPQLGLAQKELSDAQKKEAVYKMYREYKKEFPDVVDIMPQEAMKLLARDKVVFVDARGEKEMRVSMLPHAISEKYFLQDPDKYKGKKIVGYCTISYRSGLLAKKMAEKGITIYNLAGGILAWVLEGGKVYNEKGETKRIHVYNEKWNYSPEGYEPVQFGFWERLF